MRKIVSMVSAAILAVGILSGCSDSGSIPNVVSWEYNVPDEIEGEYDKALSLAEEIVDCSLDFIDLREEFLDSSTESYQEISEFEALNGTVRIDGKMVNLQQYLQDNFAELTSKCKEKEKHFAQVIIVNYKGSGDVFYDVRIQRGTRLFRFNNFGGWAENSAPSSCGIQVVFAENMDSYFNDYLSADEARELKKKLNNN